MAPPNFVTLICTSIEQCTPYNMCACCCERENKLTFYSSCVYRGFMELGLNVTRDQKINWGILRTLRWAPKRFSSDPSSKKLLLYNLMHLADKYAGALLFSNHVPVSLQERLYFQQLTKYALQTVQKDLAVVET